MIYSAQLSSRSATSRFAVIAAIAIMFIAVTPSNAQKTVRGVVLDGDNDSEVPGASVFIVENGRTVRGCAADVEGRFLLEIPDLDTVVLRVSSIGYAAYTDTLDLTASRVLNLTVRMIGETFSSDPVVILGQSSRAERRAVGTMTEVPAATLNLIRPVGTQEMLEYVPGINGFSDDGMGNSRLNIGIRGLNPRRSSRVLILEDGVPIQPAPYIYPNTYYNPPTERIERIEVLKGSAAVEYGPQTMGGVINYITSRPRSTPGGRGIASIGTNGLASGYLELGGFGGEEFRTEGQFLYKRGDGYRDNNAFEQLNGTVKAILFPSANRTIYLKANGDHEVSQATYTGLTRHSFETNPDFNPKEHDLFTINRWSFDAIMHEQHSSRFRSTTRAYVNFFSRDWWREDDVFYRASDYESNGSSATPVPWFEPGPLVRAGNGRTNFGILRDFTSLGAEHKYTIRHTIGGNEASGLVGGRLHWERFLDRKVVGDAPDAREGIAYRIDPADSSTTILGTNNHYETVAFSFFLREGIDIGRLSISAGLRFEAFEQEQVNRLRGAVYSDKSTVEILPGLGLNYGVGPINFFAGVHRGYTPPSSGALNAVGFDPTPSGFDLESEKSWNVEGGLRGTTSHLSFEIAAFNIVVENLVAAGRGTLFRNLGRAESRGVELGLRVSEGALLGFMPGLEVSWTLLDTEVLEGEIPSAILAGDVPVDISGKELPYAPHHTITAGLSRSIGSWLRMRADIHYVGEVYTDFENITEVNERGDTGPISAHTTVSASVAWLPTDRLEINLSGKNLTDEVYIGSLLHSNPGQPAAGKSSGILPGARRQVSLGVGYRFGNL